MCGQVLQQLARVEFAIRMGAQDVDTVVRMARVPRRSVPPLVARLRERGRVTGYLANPKRDQPCTLKLTKRGSS
jgi:hypothetical protein